MPDVEYKELPEGTDEANVVKPVKLSNELNIRPQIVYGWIRNGSLPAYTKGGEGRYILRDEFKAWQEAKEARKLERASKAAEKLAKEAEKKAEPEANGEDAEGEGESDEFE